MIKIPFGAAARGMLTLAKANATPISTAMVILGMVSAVVLAVKAGKESVEDIEEAKEELETDELTFGEIVRATWKRFLPVFLILGLSIACLVVNMNRMMKRYAALSTAYALSENYLRDYMETTKETVGAKKEQQIRDDVIDKPVKDHPFDKEAERGIVETGKGNTLFYDAITTRFFRSSMDKVKAAERDLAGIYATEDVVYLDDYTNALGLGKYSECGNYLGWQKTGKFDGSENLMFDYSSGLTASGEPYVAIYHYRNRLSVIR